jgi:hypothetical protein
VLVLGNKIDSKRCVSEPQLREELGLTGNLNTNVNLFMCSVAMDVGYQEGFEWMCKYL